MQVCSMSDVVQWSRGRLEQEGISLSEQTIFFFYYCSDGNNNKCCMTHLRNKFKVLNKEIKHM